MSLIILGLVSIFYSLTLYNQYRYIVTDVGTGVKDGCSHRGDKPLIIAGMPMYNEEETIGTVVTMAQKYADLIVCVDDGSSDSSARIAESCGAIVVRHRVNRGYGGALKSLFMKAKQLQADALVVLDSDGQHDASDIPKLLKPILEENKDFVIGHRQMKTSINHPYFYFRELAVNLLNVKI